MQLELKNTKWNLLFVYEKDKITRRTYEKSEIVFEHAV